MKASLKSSLIIAFSILTAGINAQSRYSSFVGGFEFGLGYSSIIDFSRENNIKYNKNLEIEQLFRLFTYIPYQLGFVSAKYLDSESYLEFGMIYSKSSVGWIYLSPNQRAWSLPGINFYTVDIPLKYYFPAKVLKSYPSAYFGIVSAWLVVPEVYASIQYESIDESYFRDAFVSLCAGVSKEKRNMRMKIHAEFAISSVLKPQFRREIAAEDRAYGGIILPFEILYTWAYIFE